ncbi:uncharacterized protein LOC113341892 [Papaver somniferum]|uniref:uncharacterized protein LOC113341892 n=1 Tax=Papaver somniferum TaxID=3469 RepID=UPI000E6FB7C5|nr:uncharacterized protein LOC113341892 [Papaver somniferum]
MVNELQIKRKEGNVGLKLDIMQAFDTVSWSFILEVFRQYGFSDSWFLVNGSPEGFFSIDRGLRQGDPLSPLIFELIEDVLSRNITKLFREGKMTTMVTRKGISPIHLFFADDIMIFCKGNMKSLRNLVTLLDSYQRASGQTVSREKSKINYGDGSLRRRANIAEFLGMPIANFPDRYLGVKVMPRAVKYHHISNVVEKIKEQLDGWKGRMLSFQDRVVLVKSVIASFSIHNIVVYKWPRKFVHQCEVAIRNFLWSGDSQVSRSFVVSYDKVCAPLNEGGLGITKMRVMNKALLMKLCWNIRTSKKIWACYLRAKFYGRNGQLVGYIKSSILPGFKWVHDSIGNENLDRSIQVSDCIHNGAWVFTDLVRQNMLVAGVDLTNLPVPMEGVDYTMWKPDYKGLFTVRSTKELVRRRYPVFEGTELLWRPSVHPALAARNWKLLREACATLDKIHEYSVRLKGYMYNSQEDLQLLSFFRVRHRSVKHAVLKECFWEPPRSNEIMLCCDVAARGNPGGAGAGVVVRDANANVIAAMSVGFGVQTNYLAELFCIIVGLEWAVKFESQNICIRTDSMSAVLVFSGDNNEVPWFLRSR